MKNYTLKLTNLSLKLINYFMKVFKKGTFFLKRGPNINHFAKKLCLILDINPNLKGPNPTSN